MNYKYLLIACIIAIISCASAHEDSQHNDGPYVFIEKDHLIETTLVDGKVISKDVPKETYAVVFSSEKSEYKNVKNLAVLSDIHGQYDLAVELFKNNKIIDNALNWSFGQGHLVIVGDIFDRGPKVNEVLWLIYKLEKQAKKSGGQVHLLLGNHEYMVLRNDLRYIHERYHKSARLLNTNYSELYGKNTVMGRWLRSKPTVIKINQHTFVHGGISQEFTSIKYDMEEINNAMRNSIDVDKETLKASGFYQKYYGSNGPIWYRGLILGDLEDSEITSILKRTQSDHMVVGHCSDDQIVHLHDQRVFGVDSSIKNGKSGEILFIENGSDYFRGTLKGDKLKLIE